MYIHDRQPGSRPQEAADDHLALQRLRRISGRPRVRLPDGLSEGHQAGAAHRLGTGDVASVKKHRDHRPRPVTYLLSALCLGGIRTPEAPPASREKGGLAAGLRWATAHRTPGRLLAGAA
jgi:hypothetical protein